MKKPDPKARPGFTKGALRDGVAQDATVLAALEDALGLALELPDTLARDVQLVAQLGQRGRLPVVESVPADEHVAGPVGQTLDRLLELGRLHLAHHRVGRVGDALVLDKVSQLRCGVLRGDRLIKARSVGHRAHRETDLVLVPPETLGDLFLRRLALELNGELADRTADLPELLGHVHGDSDGAALVGNSPLHRLTDPPRSIRREPKALLRVELLYGLHQTYVALLDEVLKGQPIAAVLLGHRDHEPQVLLDELLASPLVARLGPVRELYLLGVREQLALADVRQVLGQQFGGLRLPPRSGGIRSLL